MINVLVSVNVVLVVYHYKRMKGEEGVEKEEEEAEEGLQWRLRTRDALATDEWRRLGSSMIRPCLIIPITSTESAGWAQSRARCAESVVLLWLGPYTLA